MKNTTAPRHPIIYVYAIIASLIGVFSFMAEALVVPFPQSFLSLAWVVILIALWGWVLKVKIGKQIYWKVAAFTVVGIEVIRGFVDTVKSFTHPDKMNSEVFADIPSILIIAIIPMALFFAFTMLSLYVILFLYALTGWEPIKMKKSTGKE